MGGVEASVMHGTRVAVLRVLVIGGVMHPGSRSNPVGDQARIRA